MTKKKRTKIMLLIIAIASACIFALCVAICAAVINDIEWLKILSFFVGSAILHCLAVASIVSFFVSRWYVGLIGLVANAICVCAIFLSIIIIAVGQHHPPHHPEELTDDEVIYTWDEQLTEDSSGVALPYTKIARDSWWTDGQHYYQAKQTGKKIVMSGYTLRGKDLPLTLQAKNDTLRNVCNGQTAFGECGCRVGYYLLHDSLEVLVAFDTSDNTSPVAVLERFDGDEYAYETRGLQTLIAGTYSLCTADGDSLGLWTFYENGLLRTAVDEAPQPYRAERVRQEPTQVITLPDGRHFQLLKRSTSIYLSEATLDTSDSLWHSEDRIDYELVSKSHDYYTWHDFANHRIVRPAMINIMDEDHVYLYQLFEELRYSKSSIAQLNIRLIKRLANQSQNECGEDN